MAKAEGGAHLGQPVTLIRISLEKHPAIRCGGDRSAQETRRNGQGGGTNAVGRGARERGALEAMGPLPQRTSMGHGPRGLQRERRCVELLYPRSGPLPRI